LHKAFLFVIVRPMVTNTQTSRKDQIADRLADLDYEKKYCARNRWYEIQREITELRSELYRIEAEEKNYARTYYPNHRRAHQSVITNGSTTGAQTLRRNAPQHRHYQGVDQQFQQSIEAAL
jgi:hypothetical protein